MSMKSDNMYNIYLFIRPFSFVWINELKTQKLNKKEQSCETTHKYFKRASDLMRFNNLRCDTINNMKNLQMSPYDCGKDKKFFL